MSGAVDIVARGIAVRAAAQSGAPALKVPRFDGLAASAIGGWESILTRGHGAEGRGAGVYVADALADEAALVAHPRAVARCVDGRIVRLMDTAGTISVEQFGASGDGVTNDQPAIQAALDYAAAFGIGTVLFRSKRYAVHAVPRTSPGNDKYARDGHPLVVTSNLELRSAVGDSELAFMGVGGVSGETNWQVVRHSAADAEPNFIWRGGGIMVLGDHGPANTLPATPTIRRLVIDHVHLRGDRQRTGNSTITYPGTVPADGDGWDISDKGLACQDVVVDEIVLKGVEISGFKGELFYIGGNGPSYIRLNDCVLANTNGDAFNPGGQGVWEFIGGRIENAHQAIEGLGGPRGARMAGTIVTDCDVAFLTGGPDGFISGRSYAYNSRSEAACPPWLTLDSVDFRNCGIITMGSWVRGRVLLTDTVIQIPGAQAGYGQIRDIDLDVLYIADQKHFQTPVAVFGPNSLTVPVTGGAAGEYVQPPANISLRIECSRSELAERKGRYAERAFQWTGYLDARSCSVRVGRNVAANLPESGTKPPLSFPLVQMIETFACTSYAGRAYGAQNPGQTSADTRLRPSCPWMLVWSSTPGEYALTLDTTFPETRFGYKPGQRLRIAHNGSAGVTYRLAADGIGLRLPEDRLLKAFGDYVDIEYSDQIARWVEVGSRTAARRNREGKTALSATTIAAGGTLSATVAIAGIVPGDFVSGLSLNVASQGLTLRGEIVSAGSVAVTIANPGTAAVAMPAATLRAAVVTATS